METGTVKFFNNHPGKLFGFLTTPQGDVFFHFNNGCGVKPSIKGLFDEPRLVDDHDLREPKKGDRLVFKRGYGKRGPKADAWAYEDDYRRAQLQPGIPSTSVDQSPDEGDGMPSWNELAAVAGGIFGLMQCIPAVSEQLGLSNRQIGIFVRNTPGGKKGEELWREFTRRRDMTPREDGYDFSTFMQEILAEAGHPYTGPAS